MVLETVAAVVVVLDAQGRIVEFNRAAQELTGYANEEVRGRVVWETGLVAREEELGFREMIARLNAGEFLNRYESHWMTKDGRRRLLSWRNSAVLGDDGEVAYVIATAVDVTDERRIESELRASEERFRAAVGSLLDGFAILSPVRDESGEIVDFRYEYVNDAACRLNGLAREQLLGHGVAELFPAYATGERFKVHRRVAQTGEPARAEDVSYDGEWPGGRRVARAFDSSVVALGPDIGLAWRETTERKRAEEELQLRAELLDLAHDAVIVRDPADGRVRFWNREAQAIYGYSRSGSPRTGHARAAIDGLPGVPGDGR